MIKRYFHHTHGVPCEIKTSVEIRSSSSYWSCWRNGKEIKSAIEYRCINPPLYISQVNKRRLECRDNGGGVFLCSSLFFLNEKESSLLVVQVDLHIYCLRLLLYAFVVILCLLLLLTRLFLIRHSFLRPSCIDLSNRKRCRLPIQLPSLAKTQCPPFFVVFNL